MLIVLLSSLKAFGDSPLSLGWSPHPLTRSAVPQRPPLHPCAHVSLRLSLAALPGSTGFPPWAGLPLPLATCQFSSDLSPNVTSLGKPFPKPQTGLDVFSLDPSGLVGAAKERGSFSCFTVPDL